MTPPSGGGPSSSVRTRPSGPSSRERGRGGQQLRRGAERLPARGPDRGDPLPRPRVGDQHAHLLAQRLDGALHGALRLRRLGGRSHQRGGGQRRRRGQPPCQAAAPAGTRTSPRSCRASASCTAFVAAPLSRLSLTTQRFSARGCDGSRRMRPTNTSSRPAAARPSGSRASAGRRRRSIPGASRSSSRASSAERGSRVCRLTDSECDADHGHARAGHGDADVRRLEDLARLEHHLALLVRVVVAVLEVAGAAEHVEGDRVRIDRRRRRLGAVRARPRLGPSSSTAFTPVPDTDW